MRHSASANLAVPNQLKQLFVTLHLHKKRKHSVRDEIKLILVNSTFLCIVIQGAI